MQNKITAELPNNHSTDAAPAGSDTKAILEIGADLQALLADVFTLYLKTKNFHWHVSGSHFHDYHLMLDEQGDQLFAMTDDIAERARKLGARTIHSIGDIAKSQRLRDNDKEQVATEAMLRELHGDNQQLAEFMRSTHAVCDEHGDVATASLLENWIDQTERRSWFLSATLGDSQ
jgi:starvation-inducible DNA-binding protein